MRTQSHFSSKSKDSRRDLQGDDSTSVEMNEFPGTDSAYYTDIPFQAALIASVSKAKRPKAHNVRTANPCQGGSSLCLRCISSVQTSV